MADEVPEEYSVNYEQFRDIVSSFLIERFATPQIKPKAKAKRRSKKATPGPSTPCPQPTNTDADVSAEDLAEFTSYIASAVFLALPPDLQSLSYHAWTDDPFLQEQYSPPLTAEQTAALLPTLDPSIADSLTAYGITAPTPTPTSHPNPPSLPSPPPETKADPSKETLPTLLSRLLTTYITTLTTPPPAPSSTRSTTTACELCGRDWINLTYHHLIPRMVHAKAVKRGWRRPDELQNVAWLCGACHRFVHRFAGHEELAREYFTVERLREAEEVQRFAEWVGRVRWKAR